MISTACEIAVPEDDAEPFRANTRRGIIIKTEIYDERIRFSDMEAESSLASFTRRFQGRFDMVDERLFCNSFRWLSRFSIFKGLPAPNSLKAFMNIGLS